MSWAVVTKKTQRRNTVQGTPSSSPILPRRFSKIEENTIPYRSTPSKVRFLVLCLSGLFWKYDFHYFSIFSYKNLFLLEGKLVLRVIFDSF